MDRSNEIGKLALALSKAQNEFLKITKDRKNPFYNSKYADLENIISATKEGLSKNELAIIQTVIPNLELVELETMLVHSSGEFIISKITLKPTKQDPQGIGSALTYARRYGLSALLNVSADDDDDGNAAAVKPNGKSEDEKEQAKKNMKDFVEKKKQENVTQTSAKIDKPKTAKDLLHEINVLTKSDPKYATFAGSLIAKKGITNSAELGTKNVEFLNQFLNELKAA